MLRDGYAMRNLVDEGLHLARAAHEIEQPLLVDLESLLDSVVADATDAGQGVSYRVRSGMEFTLAPNSIGRCLANLVANAAVHGGGDVEIVVGQTNEGVTIDVSDRGPGIPEDQIEGVVQPFIRSPSSRGTGLGLTIAKMLAERNGASLRLLNRAGGGLTARLCLLVHGRV